MRTMQFDLVTLRAKSDDPRSAATITACPGVLGTPRSGSGNATLYNTNLHAKDGGRHLPSRVRRRVL